MHTNAIISEAWKCKQCDAGRPIRTMETAGLEASQEVTDGSCGMLGKTSRVCL